MNKKMFVGSILVAVLIVFATFMPVHARNSNINTSRLDSSSIFTEKKGVTPEPYNPGPDFSYEVIGCIWCEDGNCEDMEFIVDGDDLTYVHYAEMIYNCCAEMIVLLEMEESLIRFIELEHFGEEGPCYCLCDYELTGTVSDLSPGEYTVEVWEYLNDGEYQTLLCQTTITI